ncbi:MAG: tRNA pseudouridine(55) synthase TruB [Rhodospirillales bacterium]
MNGVIVVDKPEGWTSHDAVNKIRRLVGIRRVGHLGTLDPMATGVLPLVVGSATRLAQFYTRSDKVYDAVIRFGYSTDTYDREGAPTSPITEPVITREQLEPLLDRFRGQIRQTPPPISAKKVGGVPAYRLARKNVAVELKPVDVTIHSLELIECSGAEARIVVHCSAGTYLRAMAHDLGALLGCGAFLKNLKRTRSGEFSIEKARTIEQLEELAREERMIEAFIPAADLLPEFPSEFVDPTTAAFIRQGRDFRVSPFRVRPGARFVKAIGDNGQLIAIGEARLPNLYHPMLVL